MAAGRGTAKAHGELSWRNFWKAGQRNLWVGEEPEDKDSLGQVRLTGAGKRTATALTDIAGLERKAPWLVQDVKHGRVWNSAFPCSSLD